MRISSELGRFLEGPVMIILGTVDADGRPSIARAVGARVLAAQQRIELMVSGWQWPETLNHIRTTSRLAATFSQPSNYETYQVKGEAGIRDANEDDLRLSERYRTEVAAALTAQGLAPALAAHWLIESDLAVVRLHVEEIFVQTPGPGAGSALRAQA